MVEINQFGSLQPGSPQVCARCESLLLDMLDATASAEDKTFFDQHITSCAGCTQMLADAKRGGAWLEMLRDPRPEPPAALFEKILAQTSGLIVASSSAGLESSAIATKLTPRLDLSTVQNSPGQFASVGPTQATYPFSAPDTHYYYTANLKVLPFRVRGAIHSMGQTMLQPRLAMTAAMAFFSIALTLNLTGVHVSALRASDLKPANIRRGFHEANAHVVRYCDNLRVVYELEARAHDLQRNSENDSQSTPPAANDHAPKQGTDQDHPNDQPKIPAKPDPGTSQRQPFTRTSRQVVALLLQGGAANQSKNAPTAYTKGDKA